MPHALIALRQPLTHDECQLVRCWRNDPSVAPILRTGAKTAAEQSAFYRDVICNPTSGHEFYAIEVDGRFAGMGGLTYIDHGSTEISLLLGPDYRGKGIGSAAVEALLRAAKALGLERVTGECYATGNLPFWTQQIVKHPATMAWEWTL
jgi:RimJ/RimL family protein N-acetyltransferase